MHEPPNTSRLAQELFSFRIDTPDFCVDIANTQRGKEP